ncbi:MAG TPA: hypothetical protein VIT85_01600 [Solirubrobacterales bacterium]
MTEKFDLDGEVVSEEDAEEASGEPTRVLARRQESSSPVLRGEVKTAAMAAAGGALAGAATVAAVRVVGSAVGSRGRSGRRLARRRDRSQNVVASRSFLVDVHLLGR